MRTLSSILSILFVGLAAISCADIDPAQQAYYRVCTCEDQQQVSEFVSSSIQKANNYEDEEMEDVIEMLYEVGVKTHCSGRLLEFKYIHGRYKLLTPLGECETAYFMQ